MKRLLIAANVIWLLGITSIGYAEVQGANASEVNKNKTAQQNKTAEGDKTDLTNKQDEQLFGGPQNIKANPSTKPAPNPFQNLLNKQIQ